MISVLLLPNEYKISIIAFELYVDTSIIEGKNNKESLPNETKNTKENEDGIS